MRRLAPKELRKAALVLKPGMICILSPTEPREPCPLFQFDGFGTNNRPFAAGEEVGEVVVEVKLRIMASERLIMPIQFGSDLVGCGGDSDNQDQGWSRVKRQRRKPRRMPRWIW